MNIPWIIYHDQSGETSEEKEAKRTTEETDSKITETFLNIMFTKPIMQDNYNPVHFLRRVRPDTVILVTTYARYY